MEHEDMDRGMVPLSSFYVNNGTQENRPPFGEVGIKIAKKLQNRIE